MSLARIVLVEDDGEVRRRFADLLDKEPGFTVVGAFGLGAPARRFIEQESFDVLLIDLGLPDDDGRELIRFYGRLAVAGPTAAIVSPVIGGLLNAVVPWRGLFGFLAEFQSGAARADTTHGSGDGPTTDEPRTEEQR